MQSTEFGHLEHVRQPVTRARGLPNQFYVDPDHFESEKQQGFFRDLECGWLCQGCAGTRRRNAC